jgi:hypothetical protein
MPHSLQFGEASTPVHQYKLKVPKGARSQRNWLLLAARDKEFALGRLMRVDGPEMWLFKPGQFLPWFELWRSLADVPTGGLKYWLVGWRMAFALDRADLVEALNGGLVQLPKIRIGKNKGRHGGKLTINPRITEVDLVAGANKIKALDLQNFGVDDEHFTPGLDQVDTEHVRSGVMALSLLGDLTEISINKSTAAQIGWTACRARLPADKLYINCDPNCRSLERRAYHAGRNEAFFLGDCPGTTYSLDMASCYANICLKESLPCQMIEQFDHGLDLAAINVMGNDHWIADCVIRTEEPDYPLRWNGKPIFPVGTFATSLPWPELSHALRNGRVVKIGRAARYKAAPIFALYAQWYLNARQAFKADFLAPSASMLKSIFNSSLGFTAREKYEWQPWQTAIGFRYWLGHVKSPDDMASLVAAQVLDDESRWLRVAGEPREAMPFLHATITSYARVQLAEIIRWAGSQNVLYCDTDGVLVNHAGASALSADGSGQGFYWCGLVERFPPGAARINGQKNYRIGSNVIHAGAVKTRYSATLRKRVLKTDEGRTGPTGRVEPLRFVVDNLESEDLKWLNVEA